MKATLNRSSVRSYLPALLLSALCILAAHTAAAQTKIAYIDASKLLKRMPEATDASSRLESLISTWNKEAEDMQNELNRKQSDFDRRKLIMTDAERTSTEVELQTLRKRLDDYRQAKYGPSGDLYVQQSAIMKPAYDRLMKAVDEAGHEGGYDYVVDISSKDVAFLYKNSKYDLTLVVARKLGIESEILTTPLINNGPGTPGAQTPGTPGTGTPNPNGTSIGTPGAVNPNPGINSQNTNPNQPGSFNSGSYNPDQNPPPPIKTPAQPTR